MAKWIIAVCNLKGGVGKSTIALSIAGCLHRAGHGVVLVDADVRQRTLLRWAERVETTGAEDGAPVISLSGKSFRRDLDRVTQDYDVAVVDSAAGFAAEARSAALVADLVVVPVIPGAADMWALQGTLDVVEDVRAMRPELG